MKGKNIVGKIGNVGKAGKATLPKGENLSDKIQQSKMNFGLNNTNKTNNVDSEEENNLDSKDKKKKSNKPQGTTPMGLPNTQGMGTEGAKIALKAAADVIPYTKWIPKGLRDKIIDKFMDSSLGQKAVEKALNELKMRIILIIVAAIASIILSLLVFAAIFAVIMAPIALMADAVGDVKAFFSSLGNWFSGNGWCATDAECQASAEQNYFEKLDSAIAKYDGDCDINEDLITATIFYGQIVSINDTTEEDSGSIDNSNNYFNYLDVNGAKFGTPTAVSRVNRLIKVYLKGEGLSADELNLGETELIEVTECQASALAYRNYLINTYIDEHYPEVVIEGIRTKEQVADEILMMGGIDIYNQFNACSQSCSYNIGDKSYSTLKVQLTDSNGNPISGEESVYFEDYILGVVYGEVGLDASADVWKAHAIAARSGILASASSGGIKFEENSESEVTLYIPNMSTHYIYCNPDNGCAERNDGVIISNLNDANINPNPTFKTRYGLDANSELRQNVSQVVGMLVLDSGDNIVNTVYDNSIIESWKTKARENKTYTDILGETYASLASISEGNCSSLCTFAAGPYTEWKQWSPEWKDVPISTSTIGNIGCLATSVAIQIARSGVTTPLGADFNPGTMVKNYGNVLFTREGNWQWYSIEQVVPDFEYTASSNKYNLLSLSDEAVANTIISQMNEGCYLVAEVKEHVGSQHWVAIDNVVDGEIYLMDPGRADCKTISGCNGKYKISQTNCYKVKK